MTDDDVERYTRIICRANCKLTERGLHCETGCKANINGTVYNVHARSAHAIAPIVEAGAYRKAAEVVRKFKYTDETHMTARTMNQIFEAVAAAIEALATEGER